MPGILCVQIDLPSLLQVRNPPPAAVYELGPLSQGTNYLAPQKNSSAQQCECNTVMYRYQVYLRYGLRTSANLSHPAYIWRALPVKTSPLSRGRSGASIVTKFMLLSTQKPSLWILLFHIGLC